MYAVSGGPNEKWGEPISNGGPGTTAPLLATALGRTNVVVFSQFGEVVRHSGLCEFQSCQIVTIVSHQGSNEGGTMPRRRIIEGRQKVPTMSQVFFQCSTFTPKRS